MGDWVVDICILDTIKKEEELVLECITFLFLQSDKKEYICLDSDGEILSLYESHVNLYNPSDIIGKWWKKIQRRGLVRDVFGRLPHDLKNELLKLKFHDDDLIFVKVARGSLNKRIVSINSDFGCNFSSPKNRQDIKEFLKSFGILCLTPEEAIDDLKK